MDPSGHRESLTRLRVEASVWRGAYETKRKEVDELKKELELAQLRLKTVQSATANPMLLCLIDGDGYIFNERLLKSGSTGGREAACSLRERIVSDYGGSANVDVLVHIFFNREGLGRTVKAHMGVSPSMFNAFITGFNTASPMMSMLDVGTGKEAADAKIRELMRVFIRYPHVMRVYFGGGHDNGYSTNLATLKTEGYLKKVVLLQSYAQLAAEIKAFGLPCLNNDGLFLSTRLSGKPQTQISCGKDHDENVELLWALNPRPCTHHYLTQQGCEAENCPYEHSYSFPPIMLAELRDLVKQNPCPLLKKGRECNIADCPSAHQCPEGPHCNLYKQGTCKFTTTGMHNIPAGSRENKHVAHPPSLHSPGHRQNPMGSGMSNMATISPYTSGNRSLGSPRAHHSRGSTGGHPQFNSAFRNSVSGSTSMEWWKRQ